MGVRVWVFVWLMLRVPQRSVDHTRLCVELAGASRRGTLILEV